MKDKSFLHDILFYGFAILVVVLLIFPRNAGKKDERKIVGVDIKGEVFAQGYYELEYGSRVKDAILAAGGETPNADLSTINLAMALIDGEEIVIPRAEEKISKGVININTADMYKLCKLDGIGESLASNIIKYRSENGRFKTVAELKKVKGIGTEKFNKIKNKITVE